MNKNSKVPVAILSCFLIAFVIQGILKLSGIFVFEKVLTWEIFTIIDKYKPLQIIYYSLFSLITMYCLSFSLTSKPYSKKWWHYLIIIVNSVGIVLLREYFAVVSELKYNIMIDVYAYILIPFIINITSDKEDKLFKNNCFGIITTITLNIMLYFVYLGLGYWSTLLTSLIPIGTLSLPASTNFLIHLERYIGIVTFMLATNELIKFLRRNNNMLWPVDVASKKAKLEAKKKKVSDKISKLSAELANIDKELKDLEAKETAK